MWENEREALKPILQALTVCDLFFYFPTTGLMMAECSKYLTVNLHHNYLFVLGGEELTIDATFWDCSGKHLIS